MPEGNITIRIKAIDEATPVIQRIQREVWVLSMEQRVMAVVTLPFFIFYTVVVILAFLIGRITA